MSYMPVVDSDGNFEVDSGTLSPILDNNPAYKARIAVGLPIGSWLHAPASGHDLDTYKKQKATESKIIEFQKALVLYLQPYGPQIADRFAARGTIGLRVRVTKETISG